MPGGLVRAVAIDAVGRSGSHMLETHIPPAKRVMAGSAISLVVIGRFGFTVAGCTLSGSARELSTDVAALTFEVAVLADQREKLVLGGNAAGREADGARINESDWIKSRRIIVRRHIRQQQHNPGFLERIAAFGAFGSQDQVAQRADLRLGSRVDLGR